MNVLVTGGAGYIGSHTVRALLAQGHEVTVLDNLSRGHRDAVPAEAALCIADIRNVELVQRLLTERRIEGILHFAAHSCVGESMENPTVYYDNNVVGSWSLLEAGRRAAVPYLSFRRPLPFTVRPILRLLRKTYRISPSTCTARRSS